MRRMQYDRGGCLVDFTSFDAGEAVFDHVDTADAMRARDNAEVADQLENRHGDAVDGDGHAVLERDFDIGGLVGTLRGRLRHRVNLLAGLGPRIFQVAVLDRASPEICVHALRARRSRRDSQHGQ